MVLGERERERERDELKEKKRIKKRRKDFFLKNILKASSNLLQ